jgi:purine-nucleoside phosphorylase
MSTVPEAIVARHSGMKVLAISCITNLAAGLGRAQVAHAEVIEVGNRTVQKLSELIARILPRIVSLEAEVR